MTTRLRPKANCYRVLLLARYLPEHQLMTWWPVICADSEQEARDKATALYAIGIDHPPRREQGLPVRGDVTVLEVALLHPVTAHEGTPEIRRLSG
jgi:hypothetical protein